MLANSFIALFSSDVCPVQALEIARRSPKIVSLSRAAVDIAVISANFIVLIMTATLRYELTC